MLKRIAALLAVTFLLAGCPGVLPGDSLKGRKGGEDTPPEPPPSRP